jgi:hypothetical protein
MDDELSVMLGVHLADRLLVMTITLRWLTYHHSIHFITRKGEKDEMQSEEGHTDGAYVRAAVSWRGISSFVADRRAFLSHYGPQ